MLYNVGQQTLLFHSTYAAQNHTFATLSCRVNALTDSNFILRQLFKDSYRHSFLRILLFVSNLAVYFHVFQVVAVCPTTLINEYVCMYV